MDEQKKNRFIVKLTFDQEANRYKLVGPVDVASSIAFWSYFLRREAPLIRLAEWYLRMIEQETRDGEICGGNEMVLFLEKGEVIVRDECEQDEEINVGRCEYEAAKQLLRDWIKVLEEKPEQVSVIQEGNKISLMWQPRCI